MPRGLGSIQKKIILSLITPIALGFAYTPRQRARVFRQLNKEWEKIDEESLQASIESLYKNKMIDIRETVNNGFQIILCEKGEKRILQCKLEEMHIKKPKKWDKKWHMVIFDIPHSKKKAREALRFHLKKLGFYQFQKSAWVYPYPCGDEIDFLIEFYQIRPHVRQLTIDSCDNELHLKQIFKTLLT